MSGKGCIVVKNEVKEQKRELYLIETTGMKIMNISGVE
jgi:hypothetical protein